MIDDRTREIMFQIKICQGTPAVSFKGLFSFSVILKHPVKQYEILDQNSSHLGAVDFN